MTTVKVTNSLSLEFKWDKKWIDRDIDFWSMPPASQSLFLLRCHLESLYRDLPWPPSIKKVIVMTEVRGGKGDISAAAKVINIMQNINPSLSFGWVVPGFEDVAKSFQSCFDSSKVSFEKSSKGDFLVLGPTYCMRNTDYIEDRVIKTKVQGPRFAFLENAEESVADENCLFSSCQKDRNSDEQKTDLYRMIHKWLFRKEAECSDGLQMGLREGTGVLIDEERLKAPLTRKDCCPSYLLKLTDEKLRRDILETLGVYESEQLPDYDQYSFNFGYAHKATSWSRFVDFVAIHERAKNVTIVLNQKGEFTNYDVNDFCDKIFTSERLALLKEWGYGKIAVKGEEGESFFHLSDDPNARQLNLIVRPSFKLSDMKNLQLAAERLLATGDNSAAEAWAARCKLYLYEGLTNESCKKKFLEQQVKLANSINPSLGKLLELFGKIGSLSDEEMQNVISILRDPKLSDETLRFCTHITRHYSFEDALIGALKRTAWHYCIPDLMEEEADAMDDEFKSGLIKYLGSFKTPPQILTINNLPILSQRIHLKVQEYLQKQ